MKNIIEPYLDILEREAASLDVTLYRACLLAQMDPSALSRIKRGLQSMTYPTAIRLSDALAELRKGRQNESA